MSLSIYIYISIYLSLSRLFVVGTNFRGREIVCLATMLGPLACLAAELDSQAWLT